MSCKDDLLHGTFWNVLHDVNQQNVLDLNFTI